MAGHSKWSNIKRRKGAVDEKRAKIFSKIGREIQVAVRMGGPDPEKNTVLRDVVAKAKSYNMPNDNIQRSISRAAGDSSSDVMEEIQYEGYGPGGVAVMVRALTDNRNMPKPATAWPYCAMFVASMKARPSFRTLYQREGLTEWA